MVKQNNVTSPYLSEDCCVLTLWRGIPAPRFLDYPPHWTSSCRNSQMMAQIARGVQITYPWPLYFLFSSGSYFSQPHCSFEESPPGGCASSGSSRSGSWAGSPSVDSPSLAFQHGPHAPENPWRCLHWCSSGSDMGGCPAEEPHRLFFTHTNMMAENYNCCYPCHYCLLWFTQYQTKHHWKHKTALLKVCINHAQLQDDQHSQYCILLNIQ